MTKPILTLCLVFVFFFSGIHSAFSEPENQSVKKLKAGMLLTLSGSFSTAGEDCRQGIEAALALSKTKDQLELIFADSRNEPTTSISEFRRLVEIYKMPVVYTHRSSMGMAINPVSKTSKIPLLGAVGHKDFASGNKYAFQIWPRSDEEGAFLADKFIKLGHKRAAIIYTEDEWTGAVSQGFREKFLELGGSLVFDQSVLLAESDFRTLLLKLKQKSPDAIYMNLLLPQIGPMIKQARDLDIKSKYFSNFYLTRKDVLDSAGRTALEGVMYVNLDTDLPLLKKQLGMSPEETPSGLTVASYAATMLLAQTLPELKGRSDSMSVYTSLLNQKEIRTADRIYPIENRCVKFPLVIKVIRNGKGTIFAH